MTAFPVLTGFHAPQTHPSAIIGNLVHGIVSGASEAGAGGRSPSEWLHEPALQGDVAPQAVLVFLGKHVSAPPQCALHLHRSWACAAMALVFRRQATCSCCRWQGVRKGCFGRRCVPTVLASSVLCMLQDAVHTCCPPLDNVRNVLTSRACPLAQLRPTHLLTGADGVLDHLKGAVSGAASSLTLYRLSVKVRGTPQSAIAHMSVPRHRRHKVQACTAASSVASCAATCQCIRQKCAFALEQGGNSIAGQVVKRLGDADVALHHFGSCGVATDGGADSILAPNAAAVSAALTASKAAGKRAVRINRLHARGCLSP